jgi:hypothetical protein
MEEAMIQSSFPGMDPYLEAPNVWPDVPTSLMNIFREPLTPLLVPKYLAELEPQMVIDLLRSYPPHALRRPLASSSLLGDGL